MPAEISKTTMTTMEEAEVTAYHALTTIEYNNSTASRLVDC
jgi:hypothetical protein